MKKETPGSLRRLCLAILIGSLAIIFIQKVILIRDSATIRSIGTTSVNGYYDEKKKLVDLPEELRLLLQGDPVGTNQDQQWFALYRSDPDDPVLYSTYLTFCKKVPSGFHETVSRIDPDNGWFDIWEASILADECVQVSKTRKRIKTGSKEERRMYAQFQPSEFTISDSAKFEKALQLLKRGFEKPRFNSYRDEYGRRVADLLPKPNNVFAHIQNRALLLNLPTDVFVTQKLKLLSGPVFSKISGPEQQQEFRELVKVHQKLRNRISETASLSLIDVLVVRSAWLSAFRDFSHAASRVGLDDESNSYRELFEALFTWRTKTPQRELLDDQRYDQLALHGSVWANLSAVTSRGLKNPRVLTSAELMPGRKTDHALAGVFLSHGLYWFFLVVALIVWQFGSQKGEEKRSRSAREFWAFVIKTSLLPLGVFFLIRYLPFFGHLNHGAKAMVFGNYIFPFVGLGLVLLSLPIALICRKLRGGLFSWFDWAPFILALLGLLTVGFVVSSLKATTLIVMTCLGGSLVWLIVVGIRALVKRSEDQKTVASMAISSYLTSAVLMALSSVWYYQEAGQWAAKDDLFNPDGYIPSQLEAEIARRHWFELEETLETLPR